MAATPSRMYRWWFGQPPEGARRIHARLRRVSTPFSVALLATLVSLLAPTVRAQSVPDQNQNILNELKAIRQLLEKLVASAGESGRSKPTALLPSLDDRVKVPVMVTGEVLGSADAPLTIVEFTDLQCSFCRIFHATTFEEIKKNYIDTGKVRYISRDLPLDSIHPLAVAAARATRCAGEQGKYWEMRHAILVNNRQLSVEFFTRLARSLNMDSHTFNACIGDPSRFMADVQRDISEASRIGIAGTPGFVIGRLNGGGGGGIEWVRIVGAQPYLVFDAKLKDLLGNASAIDSASREAR